jgi:hypothetical protein
MGIGEKEASMGIGEKVVWTVDCGLFETDAHTALTAPISLQCQD